MQKVLKNSWGVIAISLLAVVVTFGGAFITKVKAQPSSINVQTTAVATTTVSYIGNGVATSTYQIDSYPTYSSSKVFSMAGIDAVYLYAQAAASSTATIYTFTPQFSNNGVDWYTASSSASSWQPGTVATSSITFKLVDIAGLHERIVTSAAGAAGSMYEEVVLKKNAQGQ